MADIKECPICGETVRSSTFDSHLDFCKNSTIDGNSSLNYIRRYLAGKVTKLHKRCPICNHRFRAAITRDILTGVPYQKIVDEFGNMGKQPTFGIVQLSTHKNHLNLLEGAVIQKHTNDIIGKINDKDVIPHSKNKTLIEAVQRAIMEKGQQLNEFTNIQNVKLDVASTIYDDINKLREIEENALRIAAESLSDDNASDGARMFELASGASKQLMEKQELFLDYMHNVGELQVKIYKFYAGIDAPTIIDFKILQTVMQNHEMNIIKLIVDNIGDSELRMKISRLVGEEINKMNAGIMGLIGSSRDVTTVEAQYDEVVNE